jgi:hypothetical protein
VIYAGRLTKKKLVSVAAPIILITLLSLFLLMALVAVITGQTAQAAGNGMVIVTDGLLYAPGDEVNFDIVADSAGRSLSGDLVLKVYPPASPLAATAFTAAPIYETSVRKDFSITGQAVANYQAKTGDLKTDAGGYPVKISLMQNGEEVLWGTTWLAVTDGKGHEPLDLVMLWTASSPPQRNAQDKFIDTHLLERCQASTQSGESLPQHLAFSQKYPQLKTTYAIEPALLNQLGDYADGFELVGGDKPVTFNESSPEARTAADCLNNLRQLAKGANSEIISAPYSFVSLPILARQGWEDGNGQFRLGHDVLTQALELPGIPQGTYAPELYVTTDSLRYLAATGGEHVVLSGNSRDNVQGRDIGGEVSYRLRDLSGERITSFFANDAVSVSLLGNSPDPNAFFAALVNSYVSAQPDRLVITASPTPTPPITIEQRDRVYGTLGGLSWIQSMTLGEARQKYRPDAQPATLLKYEDPLSGYVAQTYYQRLDGVHSDFEDYRAAVDNDEPELVRLTRRMYTAENAYWLNEIANPDDVNRGLEYLDELSRSVKDEAAGLDIKIDTPLVQRSGDGEATVTVVNSKLYAFTLDIVIEGNEGVSFPQGSERRVRVEAGKTQFTVPYQSEGWSRLDASARSRGHAMVGDAASIHPIAGRVWLAIGIILAGIGLGIAYIFLVVRRR